MTDLLVSRPPVRISCILPAIIAVLAVKDLKGSAVRKVGDTPWAHPDGEGLLRGCYRNTRFCVQVGMSQSSVSSGWSRPPRMMESLVSSMPQILHAQGNSGRASWPRRVI